RLERKGQVLAAEQGRSESERTSLGAKRVEMEQSLADEQQVKERVEKRLEELRGSLGERRAELERLTGRAAAEASQVAALRERVQAVRLDLERLREGVDELEARLAAARREKLGLGERESELHKRRALAEMELKQSLSEREQHRQRVSHLEGETSDLRQRIEMTHAALRIRRKELEAVRDSRAGEDVALARLETEKAHFCDSFRISHGISIEEAAAVLNPTELLRSDEELNAEVAELKRKLDSIGPVNPMADEEYRELETRHGFLSGQRQDLLDSISSTESAIRRIDATSRKRFREAFAEINRHFEVTFKQLFGGGRAGLRLLDEQDILESGIDIIAQPPGKQLQNVLLLSGGEKALTAIALMFAIFRYKPSPFCLLDEVDAPLDDANVGRFVSMLRELRETTQFIIITHNRRTMEIADHMYGVTMEEPGISKLVSVRLVDEAPAEASAAT
ncbi:MAG: chromosome segregation protein SMC, partial [Acidobacteriota bacterium]